MPLKLSLRSVPVFQFISPEQASQLAGIAKSVDKDRGEAFLLAGETVPGIYIVGEGRVGVYPPGTSRPLVELGTGHSFGEMSFLEKSKASATIRAEENGTRAALLMQPELLQLCSDEPELGRAIYHGMALTLSSKLRTTTDKIARELAVGRKLLMDLAREDQSAMNLTGIAAEVVTVNDSIVQKLDGSIKELDDLARRVPERTGTLSQLSMSLAAIKAKSLDFYPRLAKQIAAITHFIKSLEDFILQSTRD